METTVNIHLTPNSKNSRFLGFANVNVLGTFTVSGIGLWQNQDGVGVELPYKTSVKNNPKTGKPYKNNVWQYNSEMHRAQFAELIIEAYNKKVGVEAPEKTEAAM